VGQRPPRYRRRARGPRSNPERAPAWRERERNRRWTPAAGSHMTVSVDRHLLTVNGTTTVRLGRHGQRSAPCDSEYCGRKSPTNTCRFARSREPGICRPGRPSTGQAAQPAASRQRQAHTVASRPRGAGPYRHLIQAASPNRRAHRPAWSGTPAVSCSAGETNPAAGANACSSADNRRRDRLHRLTLLNARSRSGRSLPSRVAAAGLTSPSTQRCDS